MFIYIFIFIVLNILFSFIFYCIFANKKIKKIESIISNVSHELRTPLTSILGYVDVLKLQYGNDEQLLEKLSIIDDSSIMLLELVNEILDHSKLNSKRCNLNKLTYNVSNELFKVVKSNEINANAKGIFLKNNIIDMDNKLKIFGDPLKLKQILNNLLSNAIKFTNEGGVEFIVSVEKSCITMKVVDTGIGIDDIEKKIIFKSFVQSNNKNITSVGGTGLGLSITQKLVKLMKGKIELSSNDFVGTIFTVTLPIELKGD